MLEPVVFFATRTVIYFCWNRCHFLLEPVNAFASTFIKVFCCFSFLLEPLLRFAGTAKSFCFNQVLEVFVVAVMASGGSRAERGGMCGRRCHRYHGCNGNDRKAATSDLFFAATRKSLPAGMERSDVNGTAGGLRRGRWRPAMLEDGDTCSRRNS